jgi:N-acetylmuramic acid 6-phosphate etherase
MGSMGSKMAIDLRATEQRNPRTADIDLASVQEIVDVINREDQLVASAVMGQREQIAQTVAMAEAAFRDGGRLLYVGAGTSGRLGVLDASECPPTFGTDPDMVQGIIAGGPAALTRAQEGAEDDRDAGARAMDELAVCGHDLVVGIAASGTTPYVAAALTRAKALGGHTAIVACSALPAELQAVVDVAILPIVGPEVVTGSTRMKAGTATKLVLNTITTGAMIRMGKTYGNLMVDLQATNAKLADRAERILCDVCHITREDGRLVLQRAGGSVKRAIVMQLLNVSRSEADDLLKRHGGVIRHFVPAMPASVIDD